MIKYPQGQGSAEYIARIFKTQGSVFPFALRVALPCALLCGLLKWFSRQGHVADLTSWLDDPKTIMRESQAWSGFSFLVGFLVVFRTSQAYTRFWDGCTATYKMRAEWFDACSALIAFCRISKADSKLVNEFQQTLVRLFSMLHAVALAEVEDCNHNKVENVTAFKFELMDAEGIDAASLLTIKESGAKVELVYQWIQLLIVENIEKGVLSIPPPILSRCFQELANGMVEYHEALKLSTVPFPFPYAQTCEFLLLLHWLIAPFVVCSWTSHPAWASIFCFVQVFILWALNAIADEIENPFGMDANDLDASAMQLEINRQLNLLIADATQTVPRLSPHAACFAADDEEDPIPYAKSFADIWSHLEISNTRMSIGSLHSLQKKNEPKTFGSFCGAGIDIENHPDHQDIPNFLESQTHPAGIRSVSRTTPRSQVSVIATVPQETCQDGQDHRHAKISRPVPETRHSPRIPIPEAEESVVYDLCLVNTVNVDIPHTSQSSKTPEPRPSSQKMLHRGPSRQPTNGMDE